MNPKHTETRFGQGFGCIEECEALFFLNFLNFLQEINQLKALFNTIKHNVSHHMSGYNKIPQNSLCVMRGQATATVSSLHFDKFGCDVMAGNG